MVKKIKFNSVLKLDADLIILYDIIDVFLQHKNATKLEFGRFFTNGKSEVILADEISPDTCRLWDVVSEKKLDKDRFRKDLGNIIQAYQEVARRLGIIHEESNISEVKFGKPKAVNITKKK